jgi:hypothetical protein
VDRDQPGEVADQEWVGRYTGEPIQSQDKDAARAEAVDVGRARRPGVAFTTAPGSALDAPLRTPPRDGTRTGQPVVASFLRQTERLTSSSGIPLLTRSVAVAWRIRWEPNVRKVPPPAW